jgi:uncharacterized protein YdaU (DUF1376 family)
LNYYPFHLGDYATHAGHLDPIEDCAYRRLIDLYMLSEQPLLLDVELLARKIRMKEYVAAVRDVLNEFFVRTEEAWTHSRCDKELAKFHQSSETASKAGKASALRRRSTDAQPNPADVQQPFNERSTDVQRPFNDRSTTVQPTKTQDPRPNNQEPRKEKNKEGQPALLLPEWMPSEVWEHWQQHRKAIRKPLTVAAAELTLRNLSEMFNAGYDPVAAIELSIQNGWTGVFPPKPQALAPPARQPTALEQQADVIAKILRQPAAPLQTVEVFDERPKLSIARN